MKWNPTFLFKFISLSARISKPKRKPPASNKKEGSAIINQLQFSFKILFNRGAAKKIGNVACFIFSVFDINLNLINLNLI